MNQHQLNRGVARVTGEPVAVIANMGFGPLTRMPREREPKRVDWEQLDRSRGISLQPRRKRTPVIG